MLSVGSIPEEKHRLQQLLEARRLLNLFDVGGEKWCGEMNRTEGESRVSRIVLPY
jgi:hypothetical protein